MVGRANTSAFNTEIAQDIISPRLLIDASFDGAMVYVWNGIGDTIWDGNTYTGAGNLLGLSAITEGTELKIDSMTIDFEGITTAYKSLALQSIHLRNTVTVRLGLQDGNGAIIADPDIVFIGNMNGAELSDGKDKSMFKINVQNEMHRALQPTERRYTDQDHQQRHTGDTFMRHSVNAEKKSRWGSES
jgi:hypothetical protein